MGLVITPPQSKITARSSAEGSATDPMLGDGPARGRSASAAPPGTGRMHHMQRTAVVTGASSGIGAASATRLAGEGYHVVLTARRRDRLDDVASRIADAGGSEQIADASAGDWLTMYQSNVLGTFHTVQAMLPKLIDSGDGTIVIMGSTAGFTAYEGGGGYVAAKHGTHAIAATLRLELCGQPVRVIEIAPGMVKTDEFALTRYGGDAAKAAAVYAGVAEPLTADDIADAVTWAVTRPAHVNVDLMVLRPRAQAAQYKVDRRT